MVLLLLTLLFNIGLAPRLQASELDERIARLDGTSSYVDGPNCWNGAMYAAGVVDSLRMFHPSEWVYYLEHLCVEVGTPRYGDVGRLFTEDSEVHGFIYLSEDEIFAKHGEQVQWGYRRMPMSEMLNTYERTRQCRIARDFSSHCYHSLKYYRCQKNSLGSVLKSEFESSLERLTRDEGLRPRYKMTCESDVFIERERLTEQMSLRAHFLQELPKSFRTVLISSYLEQISRLLVSNRLFRCNDRVKRDANIQKLRGQLKKLYE